MRPRAIGSPFTHVSVRRFAPKSSRAVFPRSVTHTPHAPPSRAPSRLCLWQVPIEKRATIGTPTAKTYAKYGVASIGYDVMLSPYWVHALAMWVQARLPEGLVASGVFSMHKGIRFHKKNVAKMEEKVRAAYPLPPERMAVPWPLSRG